MTILPIVERELRVAARRRGTFIARSLAATGMLATWVLLSAAGDISPNQRGHNVFMALSIGAFVICLAGGVFLTADCVAAERRDGTLGLLFLTCLKGHDVVFGKLAGTSIRAIFGLLATLPVLSLPLLSGGVTGAEYWRMGMVILATLFLSLTVGLWVSVRHDDERTALMHSLCWVGGLTAAPFLASWIVWVVFGVHLLDAEWMLYPSPVYPLIRAFAVNYSLGAGPSAFWSSLAFMLALSVSALIAASIRIRRVWQQGNELIQQSMTTSGSAETSVGGAAWRHDREALDPNPFYWLAMRDKRAGKRMAMVLGLSLVVWASFWLYAWGDGRRADEIGFIWAFFIGYGMHVMAKVFLAADASRRFQEDRQSGALELLLVTPLSVQAIVQGQHAALTSRFRWVLIALPLVNLALLVRGWAMVGNLNDDVSIMCLVTFLSGTLLLFMDFAAIRWVGMQMALRASRHGRAVGRVIRRIMLGPWVAFGLFFFLLLAGGGMSPEAGTGMVIFWALSSAVLSGISGAWAREVVEQEFRELAGRGQHTTSAAPAENGSAPR